MRRKERAVTNQAEILDILARCEVMRLGLCAEGKPYVVPMHFGVENADGGMSIYFHCAPQGRKMDMLAQNASACFEADCNVSIIPHEEACHWTATYESVIGEGVVSVVDDCADKAYALDLIMRKYGFQGAPMYSEAALGRVCVLRLDVQTVCGKRNLR